VWPSPYFLLGLTILFWAGNFVVGRGLHDNITPVALTFWRWFTAWVLILPFVWKPLREQFQLILRFWKLIALFGTLGVAGFNSLVYIGLATTTATNGVLLNTTSPVWIVLLSRLIFKQPLSWRQGFGIAVAFLGVATIVTKGHLAALWGFQFHSGDLFVLAGVLCWAVYTVLLPLRPPALLPSAFLGAVVTVGTIIIVPFFLLEKGHDVLPAFTPSVMAGIFYLALFPSVLAYIFWNHAVLKVGARRAGYFIYLMPVFGALLSFTFLNESFLPYHGVGIILILLGVYLAMSTAGPR